MIIGICGFIGSGKDTVGQILVRQSFKRLSFADSLKDAVSAIFGWNRELLEGDTKESRKWRETVDQKWSNKLSKDVTPRSILQEFGTNIMRNHFHQDIWIYSLEMKLEGDVVITDCRFPNEMDMIRQRGGKIIQVFRNNPTWYDEYVKLEQPIEEFVKDIHPSEWSWINYYPDGVISNDGTLEHLENQVKELLKHWNSEKNESISKEDCSNQ